MYSWTRNRGFGRAIHRGFGRAIPTISSFKEAELLFVDT
jgi:hypothetical protein